MTVGVSKRVHPNTRILHVSNHGIPQHQTTDMSYIAHTLLLGLAARRLASSPSGAHKSKCSYPSSVYTTIPRASRCEHVLADGTSAQTYSWRQLCGTDFLPFALQCHGLHVYPRHSHAWRPPFAVFRRIADRQSCVPGRDKRTKRPIINCHEIMFKTTNTPPLTSPQRQETNAWQREKPVDTDSQRHSDHLLPTGARRRLPLIAVCHAMERNANGS